MTAGNITLYVSAGRDAWTDKGTFVPTQAYKAGDSVAVFTVLQGCLTCSSGLPGKTSLLAAPTPDPASSVWMLLADNLRFTSAVLDTARNKMLSAIIADLYTKLGQLQTLAVSSNTRLNTTADTTHSNSYTPFSVAP